MLRSWQLALREHVELVGSKHPRPSPLMPGSPAAVLHLLENSARGFAIHLLTGIEMRELGETHGHHRGGENGVTHVPEIRQRFLQYLLVVQSRHDHHLTVELNSACRQSG